MQKRTDTDSKIVKRKKLKRIYHFVQIRILKFVQWYKFYQLSKLFFPSDVDKRHFLLEYYSEWIFCPFAETKFFLLHLENWITETQSNCKIGVLSYAEKRSIYQGI